MKLAIVTDSTAFIPTAISNHPDIYIYYQSLLF